MAQQEFHCDEAPPNRRGPHVVSGDEFVSFVNPERNRANAVGRIYRCFVPDAARPNELQADFTGVIDFAGPQNDLPVIDFEVEGRTLDSVLDANEDGIWLKFSGPVAGRRYTFNNANGIVIDEATRQPLPRQEGIVRQPPIVDPESGL